MSYDIQDLFAKVEAVKIAEEVYASAKAAQQEIEHTLATTMDELEAATKELNRFLGQVGILSPEKEAIPVKQAAPVAVAPEGPRKYKPRKPRADGKMSLPESMQFVMGTKAMKAREVFEALEAKNLLPNSDKPLKYVGMILSQKSKGGPKDYFVKVGTGLYKAIAKGDQTTCVSADDVLAEVGLIEGEESPESLD